MGSVTIESQPAWNWDISRETHAVLPERVGSNAILGRQTNPPDWMGWLELITQEPTPITQEQGEQ